MRKHQNICSSPRLDAFVAEHVMGLEVTHEEGLKPDMNKAKYWLNTDDGLDSIPRYSSDLNSAMEVVRAIGGASIYTNSEQSIVALSNGDSESKIVKSIHGELCVAICLAALDAVGGEALLKNL